MSEFTEEYEFTSDLMGNRPTNGREGGREVYCPPSFAKLFPFLLV